MPALAIPEPQSPREAMTPYERAVWDQLSSHWAKRANRRGLPNWVSEGVEKSGDLAARSVRKVAEVVPEAVKDRASSLGAAVGDVALRPTAKALAAFLELVDEWVLENNDPATVERLAEAKGLSIESFKDLRRLDLEDCDRLLTRHTLKWRGAGALEGGAMGALAMVPVAGLPVSILGDALVIQVLSVSIAARVAYSYGIDARSPAEQDFIARLVNRSFLAQAAKAKPMQDAARARWAVMGRKNWSKKLRDDHRLLAALEKLAGQLGPKGAHVPVQTAGKLVWPVAIVLGAGTNAQILGAVAKDAQRYCQTRVLCEKYGLPIPTALTAIGPEDGGDFKSS